MIELEATPMRAITVMDQRVECLGSIS